MSGSAYASENQWPSYYGGAPQMDPQGIFGKVLGAIAGPVGGMIAGPAGGVVGGVLGRQLGRVIPFGVDPSQQFAPQGAVGDMIGAVGPTLGQHLGGMFGQAQLGQQLGNVLGTVGPMLPFAAGPQQAAGQVSPELDPMGFNLGRLIRGAQQAVQTAQQAVNAVNTVRQFLPLAATADAAGNGLDGGVAGQVSPELDPMGFNLGRLIRGAQQAVQTAQQAVNAVNTVRQFLPLAAGPEAAWAGQQQQQFAPQGAIGNLLGQVGPTIGQHLGGMFGQAQLGQQLGNVLGTVGPMLPFAAAPQPMTMLPPELDPMGFSFGKLVRGAQQAVRTAQQAVDAVNTVRQFLPLAAGPEQQFAPQGAIGNLIGQLGVPLGGALGGLLGHQQFGQQLGGVAAQLGPMLPFAAGPQQAAGQVSPELDPMGFNLGRLIRGAQQAVHTAQQAVNAVNTVRQFLPLAAQPQMAGQASPELDPQGFGFLQNWLKQRPPILTTVPTHQHYGLPF